jgi:hypothetical protein
MLKGAGSSDKPNADRLRPLATLDHVDRDPLAFCQVADSSAVQSRRAHENVLSAAVADDEAEPPIGGIKLDRAGLLHRGLTGALIRPLGPRTPRRLLERGRGIDTEDLGYLHALLARADPNLKRGARRHGTVAATLPGRPKVRSATRDSPE